MEQYFTCLECITSGAWKLGSMMCKSCTLDHIHKNDLKDYYLKKKDNICDICTNSINHNDYLNIKDKKTEIYCNKIKL